MKKLLFLFSLLLLSSTAVVLAQSTFLNGKGTASDPFMIKTSADLNLMADSVNKGDRMYAKAFYKIDDSVDTLDLFTYSSWAPIGVDYSKPFLGHFDGNNKSIENIRLGSLFGSVGSMYEDEKVDSISISNIRLTKGDITVAGGGAGGDGGVLINEIPENSAKIRISNCHNQGVTIKSTGAATIGGLIGYVAMGTDDNDRAQLLIVSCSNSANVDGGRAGGLIGAVNNMGKTLCTIKDCYNTGRVTGNTGSSIAGGIVGLISPDDSSSFTLSDSYSAGELNSEGMAGGLVGDAIILSSQEASITIENCVTALSSFSGDDNSTHRILGYYAKDTKVALKNNYAYAAGYTGTGDVNNDEGGDWSGQMAAEPISLWDPSVWEIDPTDQIMPKLKSFTNASDCPNPLKNLTSVSELSKEDANIFVSGGQLVIDLSNTTGAAAGTLCSIYNISGQLCKAIKLTDNLTTVPLPRGIYVICMGRERAKVVIP